MIYCSYMGYVYIFSLFFAKNRYNSRMTTLTLDIPESKTSQYSVLFTTLAREYSLEDIEDLMLSLHMSHNDAESHPISELRAKYAS